MLRRLVRRAVYICRAAQVRYARLIALLYCTRSVLMMRSSLPTEYVEYAQSIRLRLHMIRCESVCARCQCT